MKAFTKIAIESFSELFFKPYKNKKIYKFLLLSLILSIPFIFIKYKALENAYPFMIVPFFALLVINNIYILRDTTFSIIKDAKKMEYFNTVPIALLILFVFSILWRIGGALNILIYAGMPLLIFITWMTIISFFRIFKNQ
jgi:hypothetical protein